jgi:hypothetical protein
MKASTPSTRVSIYSSVVLPPEPAQYATASLPQKPKNVYDAADSPLD